MKWDGKNKRKIYHLLWCKCRSYSKHGSLRAEAFKEWQIFLNSLEIIYVYRDDSRSKWMRKGDTPNEYDIPATSKKHIIVKDPYLEEYGLRIPKEVAEKFLVLGVP